MDSTKQNAASEVLVSRLPEQALVSFLSGNPVAIDNQELTIQNFAIDGVARYLSGMDVHARQRIVNSARALIRDGSHSASDENENHTSQVKWGYRNTLDECRKRDVQCRLLRLDMLEALSRCHSCPVLGMTGGDIDRLKKLNTSALRLGKAHARREFGVGTPLRLPFLAVAGVSLFFGIWVVKGYGLLILPAYYILNMWLNAKLLSARAVKSVQIDEFATSFRKKWMEHMRSDFYANRWDDMVSR